VTRLLLVRHGQSVWNAEGRWQGRADPPLSALGEAQARAAAPGAAALLARAGAAAPVACSPLARAHRTAALLAEVGGLSAPAPVPGLEERGAGPWTGLTHAEIDAGWPGARAQGRRPAGFEQDASLLARVTAALLTIATAATAGTPLVVTHEGVIRALERAAGHDDGKLENLGARWFALRDGVPEPDGPRVSLT
jgi:broad specificity phosphatase PhoE